MSVSYKIILPSELNSQHLSIWRTIQSRNQMLASPYFSPEFTQIMGRVRKDVRIAIIENYGKPVGFFPYQRAFLGCGKPVGGPLSDYHGVICEQHSDWNPIDLMDCADLITWEFDHLVDCSGKFSSYISTNTTSPQINLSIGFENYKKLINGGPSNFERKMRKLEKEIGEIKFTFHDTNKDSLNYLFKWKSHQYRANKLPDAFNANWTRNLIHEVMSTQTESFSGVCSVLQAGNQTIAIHAGMRSQKMLHWWFPAYDRAYEKYSPGIILLFQIVKAISGIGINLIDLGKGDDRYKRSVMNDTAALAEGWIERPSLIVKARKLRRAAEIFEAQSKIPFILRLPLRAIRRMERAFKYR